MEKSKVLTTSEIEFLEYIKQQEASGQGWTFMSAALALKYRSPNSITRMVQSLRKKGYHVENRRTVKLAWKRNLTKEELEHKMEELKKNKDKTDHGNRK